MPGETTDNNEVHYHLSANVQFDKDNAFNGEEKNYGTWVNKNKEGKFKEIQNDKTFFYSGELDEEKKIYYINDELQIDYLIDNNNEVTIYGNSKERYSYTNNLTKARIVSIDNKWNVDKTKAGEYL